MNVSDKDVQILTAIFGRGPGQDAHAMWEQLAVLVNSGARGASDGEARIDFQGGGMDILVETLAEAVVRSSGAPPGKLDPERFVDGLVKMGFERHISDQEVDLLFDEFGIDGKWLGAGEIARMIMSGRLAFDGRGFAYAA